MVGPVDSAHALQVEGSWYWPATPRPLIDATADLHAERIDPETWQQRVAARAPYRLPPAAQATPRQRRTPAPLLPRAAGKVHCPLKPPLPLDHPSRHLLPLVDPEPSPVGPAKICRQTTITLPPEAGATHRIRGIAPTSILLAFQLHHANTRKLATWADTLEGENGKPPRRRPTRRRKSKPLGTWTPAGHLDRERAAA